MSQDELEAAHCWEAEDRVPGRPAMTAFRRAARLHQARWREANGHPIGSQPMRPRPGKRARAVGSRLDLSYAVETGANFVTAVALDAARARVAAKEAHQSIDGQRLWADLLWSTGFAINLFASDVDGDVLRTWWPDVPSGRVVDVRFLHSPGWLDPDYLGNLQSLDVVFVLDVGGGERGVLAVTTRYHERQHRAVAKPERLPRYVQVADWSEAFVDVDAAVAAVNGTDLLMLWLQHLLVHSMLQHPRSPYSWGRLVLVHPSGNVDVADQAERYSSLLRAGGGSTFAVDTLERLLDAGHPHAAALRDRYVPSP